MAKGESTWSSKGEQVKKVSFEPLPAGWYELKLGGPIEVRKAAGEGKFSRLSVRFSALGTGQNGGKDRIVFHDFYLRTEPNEKGTVLVKMGGQLVDFTKALGDDVDGAPLRKENGEAIIDPLWLKKWLENREGEVVKGRVKVEKDQNGEPRNKLTEFEEGEARDEDEDEDEDIEDEKDEAEEEDAEDEDDEFEKALAAKKAKAAAAKKKKGKR